MPILRLRDHDTQLVSVYNANKTTKKIDPWKLKLIRETEHKPMKNYDRGQELNKNKSDTIRRSKIKYWIGGGGTWRYCDRLRWRAAGGRKMSWSRWWDSRSSGRSLFTHLKLYRFQEAFPKRLAHCHLSPRQHEYLFWCQSSPQIWDPWGQGCDFFESHVSFSPLCLTECLTLVGPP